MDCVDTIVRVNLMFHLGIRLRQDFRERINGGNETREDGN